MTKTQNKTIATDESVKAFLNGVENDQKREDCFTVCEMMERIAGAPPKMWGKSIVGFGEYHYKYDSGREGDFMIAGFSPRAQNLTLYIMDGFSEYDDLLSRLGKHKTGKSCLYVKRLSDVNMEVLEELVTASVKHMEPKRTDR